MALIKRYQSTIHGNYTVAALRYGMVTAVVLLLYVAVRILIGNPAHSSIDYFTDGILVVMLIVSSVAYRNAMEEKKVTFKELFLFTILTVVVASVMYALFVFVVCMLSEEQMRLFVEGMKWNGVGVGEVPATYWAILMLFSTLIKMLLMGGIAGLLIALLLKNEQPMVKTKY